MTSKDEDLQVSSFGQDAYGIQAASKQAMIDYGYALLTIAGGDGEVSKAERQWLDDHQRKFGGTEEVIAAYDNFDHKSADLKKIVSGITTNVKSWNAAPHLIYHAIQMSSADGQYADGERKKVVEAARLMNVADDVVLTLEALIRLEKAAYDIRAALFHINTLDK